MSLENEKEVQQLRNRLRELAEKSFRQNMFSFTGFLGLSEQDIFWRMEPELRHAGYTLCGGLGNTDRKMIRFGDVGELGYEVPFPIVCIHIRPLMAKFADHLSHRDFLGALMNLGIERSTLGDIKVGDKEAFLFCLESIADYICENLQQIKHTHVSCGRTNNYEEIPEEEPKLRTVQASSMRIDGVISKVYNKSRSECLDLFRGGKIFLNGRLCENPSALLKKNDVVNARGYGKFVVSGDVRETRKGKLSIAVAVFR